jgi:hypothetical protein
MTINTAEVVLALCILAHAVASRIPTTRGTQWAASVVYVLALVLVAWLLYGALT